MKFWIFCFALLSASVSAQTVSDFKYVVVSDKFSGFDENQYHLNRYLEILLKKKEYTILNDTKNDWPVEVQQNPCLALEADVEKEKSFLKNKLALVIKDCYQTEIFRNDGESKIKDFNRGYQDALKNATQSLSISYPKDLDYEKPTTADITATKPEEPKIQGNVSENSWFENGIEFSDGSQTFVLTGLKDNSYILIQKDNKKIIGQLYPSTRKGIFHTTITDGTTSYTTIGYYDGENLSIEYPDEKNTWKLVKYKIQN